MGYAGLNIEDLARLLARHRVVAEAIEDDSWGDHCVVRLTDMRHPHGTVLLFYENMGVEPRRARCVRGDFPQGEYSSLGASISDLDESEMVASLDLIGRRGDDPERLASWIGNVFQSLRTRSKLT